MQCTGLSCSRYVLRTHTPLELPIQITQMSSDEGGDPSVHDQPDATALLQMDPPEDPLSPLSFAKPDIQAASSESPNTAPDPPPSEVRLPLNSDRETVTHESNSEAIGKHTVALGSDNVITSASVSPFRVDTSAIPFDSPAPSREKTFLLNLTILVRNISV